MDTACRCNDTGAHVSMLAGGQDGDWLPGKLYYHDDSPLTG